MPAGTCRLRILATSDLHMNLLGYDSASDRPDPAVGLTRTATLIARARAEAAKAGALTLLMDNGDSIQGTAMGDLVASGTYQSPLMDAFRLLGYDVVGLGNHDFNYGLNVLTATLTQAPCPVVNSNVKSATGQNLPFAPWTILNREVSADGHPVALRVGVFSVLPPQTLNWDIHHLQGQVTIDDIVPSALLSVETLKANGADVIVALCHSGIAEPHYVPEQENAAVALAATEGIDAVIVGHTHQVFPGEAHRGKLEVDVDSGTLFGKPAVMPGSNGSHLGVIDLTLVRPGGKWTVLEHSSDVRAIATRRAGRVAPLVEEDPDLRRFLEPIHTRTLDRMRQPLGWTSKPLHSYFSDVASDAGLELMSAAQAKAVEPYVPADLPLLSAVAPAKSGGRAGPEAYTDIPQGPLDEQHLIDLQVYPDVLSLLKVAGRVLSEWLEFAASRYVRVEPGATGIVLLDPAMPAHASDRIYGLRYAIDLSAPPRYAANGTRVSDQSRIRNLEFKDAPVQPDMEFAVVVNGYRAHGGGNVPALKEAEPLVLPTLMARDALRDFIRGGRLERHEHPFRFLPMPGTTVTLPTGSRAMAHLSELPGVDPSTAATGEDGFLNLTLSLHPLANDQGCAYIGA